ncbi:MAG: histone deacetylase family protein [Halofilum sp. (in: g-proteobacteria)]|nr:histone deacetylase family protein [Halofilum sp. (in: g-proteobacteria)]
MTVAWITHPDCRRHEMGPDHPERPRRLEAIEDQLGASGLDILLRHVEAPAVTREQLLRVHDADYLDRLEAQVPEAGYFAIDDETAMNPYTLAAARRAAGAVIAGVDRVLGGESAAAFCAVRPPGHHAERDRAMGFCFYGNLAVGVAHAIEHHGLERVAVADFDAHHGNGTEHLLQDRAEVLLCSCYQHPLFPHWGPEDANRNAIHVPLAAGAKGTEFRAAIGDHWLPALEAFRPQLLLIGAGFDGHAEDEMSDLLLGDEDYAWVTRQLADVARRHAGGRIVSSLEGGYSLPALGRCVARHVDELL